MLLYNTMKPNKRELKHMERQLGANQFPAGLRVTWIFDTRANLEQALVDGLKKHARLRTLEAIEQTGLDPGLISSCLQFDSEEACTNSQKGNWLARLTQLRRIRH